MELLILRHAKSSWRDMSLADKDRPLNGRGKRDAQRMGRFMREEHLLPDMIVASTAVRVRSTVERLLGAMEHQPPEMVWRDALYATEPEIWLNSLSRCPSSVRRVLIVGHNPELEQMACMLPLKPPAIPPDGKLLPTATLVELTFNGTWQSLAPRTCQLRRITRPKSLSFMD